MLAALLLAPQTLLAACRSRRPAGPLDPDKNKDLDKDAGCPLCVVVGLGGGALPMALHGSLPRLRQWVAELDPDLIPVAQRWCSPLCMYAYMYVIVLSAACEGSGSGRTAACRRSWATAPPSCEGSDWRWTPGRLRCSRTRLRTR